MKFFHFLTALLLLSVNCWSQQPPPLTADTSNPLTGAEWQELRAVYVDGNSEASGAITNWTQGTVASLMMGVNGTNTTTHPYLLDEARLYNRALGSGEIIQLPVT